MKKLYRVQISKEIYPNLDYIYVACEDIEDIPSMIENHIVNVLKNYKFEKTDILTIEFVSSDLVEG